MRVPEEIWRNKPPNVSLKETRYLSLKGSGIGVLERFECCPNLETLILSDNCLIDVDNIVSCPNLWKVDLSNNRLCTLYGISRFFALGTVILCNNNLNWLSLSKIRHLTILNLYLSGNPGLWDDPHYRIHVIDSLPNVWALDGKIITSSERKQCEHFFHNTAVSTKPVRHKGKDSWPGVRAGGEFLKDRIWGRQTKMLFRKFAVNPDWNIDLDMKRLQYLTCNLQHEFILESFYVPDNQRATIIDHHPSFMEDLLQLRNTHLDTCNMILVLLVASLEFSFPKYLIKSTLDMAKMNKIGNINTMDLFLLPKELRSQVAYILLSAAKVDQDLHVDDGLYDQLYLSLFHLLDDITELRYRPLDVFAPRVYSRQQMNHRSLLSAEVIQLFCVVPAFFELIDKDPGVMTILIMATRSETIIAEIIILAREIISTNEKDIGHMCESIAKFIQAIIQKQVNIMFERPISLADQCLCKVTTRNVNKASPLLFARYHSQGIPSPRIYPTRVTGSKQSRFPRLGDKLLLSPLTIGKIITLPEPFVALIELSEIPAEHGGMVSQLRDADQHYKYIDLGMMEWCESEAAWRNRKLSGDSISLMMSRNLCDISDHPEGPHEMTVLNAVPTPRKQKRPMSSHYKDDRGLKLNVTPKGKPGPLHDKTKSQDSEDKSLEKVETQEIQIISPSNNKHTSPTTRAEAQDILDTSSTDHSVDQKKTEDDVLDDILTRDHSITKIDSNHEELKSVDQPLELADQPDEVEVAKLDQSFHSTQSDKMSDYMHEMIDSCVASELLDQVASGEKKVGQVEADAEESPESSDAQDFNVEKPDSCTSVFVKHILGHLSPEPPPSSPRTGDSPRKVDRLSVREDPSQYSISIHEHPMTSETSINHCQVAAAKHTLSMLDNYSGLLDLEQMRRLSLSSPFHFKKDRRLKSGRPRGQTPYRYRGKATIDAFPVRFRLPRLSDPTPMDEYSDKLFNKTNLSLTSHKPKPHPTRKPLHIQRGTKWLACGRDIYSDLLELRPSHVHVPGWKDGIPASMNALRTHFDTMPNILLFSKDKRTMEFVYKRILNKDFASTPTSSHDETQVSCRKASKSPEGVQVWNQEKRRLENLCIPCLQKNTVMVVE